MSSIPKKKIDKSQYGEAPNPFGFKNVASNVSDEEPEEQRYDRIGPPEKPPPSDSSPKALKKQLEGSSLWNAMAEANDKLGGGGGPRKKSITQQTIVGEPQTEEQKLGLAQSAALEEQGLGTRYAASGQMQESLLQAKSDIASYEKFKQEEASRLYKDYKLEIERRTQHRNMQLGKQKKLDAQVKENTKNLGVDAMWKKKGSGARVISAIAVAMGSIGASLTNGQNYALQIIENEIEGELQAQRDRLSVSRDEASNQRNIVAQATLAMGDVQAGYHSAKAALHKTVRDMMQDRMSLMSSEVEIQKGEQAIAKENIIIADNKKKAVEASLPQTTETVTRVSGGGGGKKKDFTELLKEYVGLKGDWQEIDIKGRKAGEEGSELDVMGLGNAPTKAEAIKFRAQIAGLAAAHSTMNTLKEARKKASNVRKGISYIAKKLPSDIVSEVEQGTDPNRAAADNAYGMMLFGIIHANSGAQAPIEEHRKYEKAIPHPYYPGTDKGVTKAWDMQINQARKKVQAAAETMGISATKLDAKVLELSKKIQKTGKVPEGFIQSGE